MYPGAILARHDDRWGNLRKAESPIIAVVADKEHKRPSEVGRSRECFENQCPAYANSPSGGIRRDRTQEQSADIVDSDRPVTYCTDKSSGFFRHQAQGRDTGYAYAI